MTARGARRRNRRNGKKLDIVRLEHELVHTDVGSDEPNRDEAGAGAEAGPGPTGARPASPRWVTVRREELQRVYRETRG